MDTQPLYICTPIPIYGNHYATKMMGKGNVAITYTQDPMKVGHASQFHTVLANKTTQANTAPGIDHHIIHCNNAVS